MLVYVSFMLLLGVVLKFAFTKDYKDLVLKTALLFSVFIVFVTETLSVIKSLNFIFVISLWSLFSLFLLSLLLRDKNKTISVFRQLKSKISNYYKSSNVYEKGLIFFCVSGLSLLLIQGIIYPPNNWDSLTYHMSRIMFWISNESISHFQTNILRHLYQPPFVEYFILNLNLINGNDYLSNSVQLFFLILILFTVYTILSFLKLSRFLKLLAVILVFTIPSVELQATTTKNDIVCAFFVMVSIYFVIKLQSKNTIENYLFLGLAIGLGFLTKGTAYLFLAPIILFLAVNEMYKLINSNKLIIVKNWLVLITAVSLINFCHYYRNYSINKNIINIDENESKTYTNESMDSKLLLSNLTKNCGLHLGFPIRESSDKFIRNFNKEINVSIDDKRLNYLGLPYEGARNTTHEDYVPNTLVFLLSIVSFGVIIIRSLIRKPFDKITLVIVLIIFSQILLFAGYLKWQPWHTRLHIPIFIFSVIPIVLACQLSKWYKKFVLICIPIIIFSFTFYFLFNNLRPIISNYKYTKNITISDTRFKKYFANQPYLYNEYSTILNQIYDANPHKIGLNLADWEYPLLHSFYYDNLKLVAVNVYNCTNKIKQDQRNIDLIVSNTNIPFILLNGVKYTNESTNHSYIWLYKKVI